MMLGWSNRIDVTAELAGWTLEAPRPRLDRIEQVLTDAVTADRAGSQSLGR